MRALIILVGVCFVFGFPLKAQAEPGSSRGFNNNRDSSVTASSGNGGVQLSGRIEGTTGGQRQGTTTRQGNGSTSTASAASAIAAAQAAAAAFNACQAASQAEVDAGGLGRTCGFTPAAAAGAGGQAAPAAPAIDPAVLAQQALAQLPIPAPQVQIGPPPTINEWNMAAVGYPLWLWTDDADSHTTTITEQGITLTLQATRRTTRFDLGDGTTEFCGTTTPWHPGIEPGTPSPTCGHIYQLPSAPGAAYQISATTIWDITWAALGQTGTLTYDTAGPVMPLPVGELHALRTG